MTNGIEILLLAHSANICRYFDTLIALQGYALKARTNVRLECDRLEETLDLEKRGGDWREKIVWGHCCCALFGTYNWSLNLRGCIAHNFTQGILLNSLKIEIRPKSGKIPQLDNRFSD